MTSDKVYKLIEDNGLTLQGDIEHFAELVAQAEREACAKVCEAIGQHNIINQCATAIRARGEA